ncbi:MAG: ABC transporter permease [Terrimesophilobacter sp.]
MSRQRTLRRSRLRGWVIAVYIFLLAPIAIVVVSAFNSGEYLQFPPAGFSLKWFTNFAQNGPLVKSFFFSLELAAVTTVISVVIGTLAALYVVRFAPARLTNALRFAAMSPMVLPVIVTGLALLTFLHSIGMGFGSFLGLLIGHVLISVPYVFLNVTATLVGFDRSLEEAARSLGSGQLTVFRRITLPLTKGGIISGAMFSFIISFDQFPVSLMLSGRGTTPFPIQMFESLRFSFDPTVAAAATVSLLVTVVAVVAVERFVGLESVYGLGDD